MFLLYSYNLKKKTKLLSVENRLIDLYVMKPVADLHLCLLDEACVADWFTLCFITLVLKIIM